MPVERRAADLVITNARVRTLDSADSVVQALAAKHGRIIGLGTDAEILPLVDRQTERVDAAGRTVLPGFIDGHTHFQGAAIQRALLINWSECSYRTIEEALAIIGRQAMLLPPGGWVLGDGYIEQAVAEQRFPTRGELDAIVPSHPVAIGGTGKHMMAANSLALQLAGITRDTPDPPGGQLDRDEAGEPTGVLRARGKLRLDPARSDTVIPSFSLEQRMQALRQGFQHLAAHGITTIHEMVPDPTEIMAYQRLRQDGDPSVRVQLLIRGIESNTPLEHVVGLGLQPGFGDEWLKLGGIKMSVDGAFTYRTAAVYEPYPGDDHNCGIVRIPQEELDEAVAKCHQAGLRVILHAIGQRAVDMAMHAIERALARQPRADHRHRIEHAYLTPRPGQLERMGRLGIVVSPQASFIYGFGEAWLKVWGEDGLPRIMPLRSMLGAGLRVMGGTDFPVSPINPFIGLQSAVARQTRAGTVLDPREAIDVRQALRLQTTGAAYGGFEERLKGSLELGKLADCIVVSEDPFAVPPERLGSIQVDTTIVGGRAVYERPGTAPAV